MLSTGLCTGLTFLPELLLIAGGTALAPPTVGSIVMPLKVQGMSCEACQLHVKQTLERSSGVISAAVDFQRGTAEVLIAKDWAFDVMEVNRRLILDGFELSDSSRSSSPDPQVDKTEVPSECALLPLKVPDLKALRPEGWDDDADGIWEPGLIGNPALESCAAPYSK